MILNLLKVVLWIVAGLWCACVVTIEEECWSDPVVLVGFLIPFCMFGLCFFAGFFVPLEKWETCPVLSDRYYRVSTIILFMICTYINLNFPHYDSRLTRLFSKLLPME